MTEVKHRQWRGLNNHQLWELNKTPYAMKMQIDMQ